MESKEEGKEIVVIERFSITIHVWQVKGFQSPQGHGDQKGIGHHNLMEVATEFDCNPTIMIKFGCHWMTFMISIDVDGPGPFLVSSGKC